MKVPQTEAEWEAYLDAEERELIEAKDLDEWREIFARQMDFRDKHDTGPGIPAHEVLAELRGMVAKSRARRGASTCPEGPSAPDGPRDRPDRSRRD